MNDCLPRKKFLRRTFGRLPIQCRAPATVRFLVLFAMAAIIGMPTPVKAEKPPFGQPVTTFKKGDKLFLWEVVKHNQRGYLLGSIHILPASAFPLDEKYEVAFHKSDAVAVEVDTGKAQGKIARQTMLQMGMLPQGKELKDVLSPALYKKLEAKCKAMNVPVAAFKKMKPWLVAIALPLMEIKAAGDYGHGVDMHYLLKAKASGKPVVELETYGSQLGIFNGLSNEEQEALLENALLQGKDGNVKHFEELVQIWLNGDRVKMEVKMSAFARNQPKLKKLHKMLVIDRNHQMTARIEKLLASGKKHLIIVGAGHMAGPDGIVHLLRKKGYRVRQVSR